MSPPNSVCLGVIVGVHGVRGLVRVKSFTADPADVTAYGPVSDETGSRSFALALAGVQKGVVLAKIEGVDDRDAAEALKGITLHVARDRLPPPEEEEFYHADLIGLDAVLTDGTPLGTVAAIHDYGAGESLEVRPSQGKALLVPFTRAAVPTVDLAGRRVVIDPPAGLFGEETEPAAESDKAAAEAEVAS